MNSCSCPVRELFGKGDAVAFDNDINIFIRAVQKKITDKPPDNICGTIDFICYPADVLQYIQEPWREALLHEVQDIPLPGTDLFLALAHGGPVINLLLADQNVQEVGSGDNTNDDSLVDDRQDSLFALDNIFLNFENISRRWYRHHLCGHVFAHGYVVKLMVKRFFEDLAGYDA